MAPSGAIVGRHDALRRIFDDASPWRCAIASIVSMWQATPA